MENIENKINLELKPEIARGDYSNLAIISHSRTEFVIDFAEMLPGMPKPEIVSRILMNPEHAKMLLNALSDNIIKYENNFGKIKIGMEQKETFNLSDFTSKGTKS